MKLTILKENLLKGLSIISRVTSKSLTLPILNNVLLSTEKNFLKISGTDLEMGVNYWSLAKVEKEGGIALPAKFLIGVISLIPDEKISLSVTKNTLLLEGKKSKSQIKGFSPDDFPIIPKVESEKVVEVDGEAFSHGLSQIVDTASPSQARPEISGVCFSLEEKIIEAAATDSFRLAEKKIPLLKGLDSGEKTGLIVLQKAAREVVNVFGEGQGKVSVSFNSNQIMFEGGMPEASHPKIQIVSRLIEGEYPNYKEIIPKDFKTSAVLNRQEVLAQIKTASLFSGKVNEVKIKTFPEKSIIEVSAQDPDTGESSSETKGTIDGEPTEVSFNYRFLVDGLSNMKSKEILFGLNGEGGPGLLRPMGDDTYIYVVMPIKSS